MHRTADQIDRAVEDDDADFIDPESDNTRAINPAWLIVVGICPHLGCVPLEQRSASQRNSNGGWFCACHGSIYDTSGRIVLLRAYDPAAPRVEVPVRESLGVALQIGQTLEVRLPALGEVLPGSVEEIIPVTDPGARTMLIKVQVPYDARLLAGMFARVGIPSGEQEQLLISEKSIS